jgi:hypothetical protein
MGERSWLLGLLAAVIGSGCGSEESNPAGGAGSGAGGSDGGAGGAGASGGAVELPTQTDHVRLASYLEELSADAMQGRLTGSPSGAVAEQYVISALEAMGYSVQTQDVPLPVFELGSPVELAIVDAGGSALTTFRYIDDYREVMFAGSGAVSGELYFVGQGLEASYEGIDVTGRVVAMLTGSLQAQLQRAEEHGALGVVFVPAGLTASYDDQLAAIYQPYLFGLGSPVDPALLLPDMPAVMMHVAAVQDLLGASAVELEAVPTPFDPAVRVRLELHGTAYPEATCKNVLATLPGTHPTLGQEVIAVGAHYDHIGVGADGISFAGASDNASGAAVVLELAHSLRTIAAAPERTVLLALWCGEEQGIYGSRYYVEQAPLLPLASTALYVNLDNIADPPGPYLIRAVDVPIQEVFLAPTVPDPIQERSLAFQCGSDECPFHEFDVPFLRYLCFGQRGHTRDDSYANADLEGMTRVADTVLLGVEATAYEVE